MNDPTPLRVAVPEAGSISALLTCPPEPHAGLVLAHGAGAGMNHPFMADLAEALAGRGVATLRYQFPFMEQGSRRPDLPAVAHRAVRAAVGEACERMPGVALFAGGKSFGGRMTSQAQALQPLPGVRGLVFVGFPLHAAGKPSATRASHLTGVGVPMLFLQGTRDALADLALIEAASSALGPRATLRIVEGADHAFHVLVRSGRTDTEVLSELAAEIRAWTSNLIDGEHRGRRGHE
jgi:predicted alpha/beta-hydrolase family hydrolase